MEKQPQEKKPILHASSDNLIDRLFFGTAEQTFHLSAMDPDSQRFPFNPDPLYQRTGDYTIYEEMLEDDQISVALQLKKDMVLGSGFDIVTEDDDDTEVKEDLERALKEELQVPFEELLEQMLTAYEFGFSFTEKIFGKRDDGSLFLNKLKTRHPNTWLIWPDAHGNIERITQRGTNIEDTDIDPNSLIHYQNRPRFQNTYGTSDLLAAHPAWFSKRQIVRFYAIFLEKAASPIPVARYDTSAPKQAIEDIFNAIKNLQTKTALTIPKEIEMEFLQTTQKGEAFVKAINLFNMFIARSLFIPDLLGFGGSETAGGSFSLGKEHMAVFFKHIKRRQLILEKLIDIHILRPLTVFNHGFVDNFPKFKFKAIKDEMALEMAETWLKAVNGKTYKPSEEEINHFRSSVNYPEGEVEFVEPPAAPDPTQVQNPGLPGEAENVDLPDEDDAEETKEVEIDKDDVAKMNPDDKSKMGLFPKTNARVFDLPPGDFHKRTDFRMIESQMMSSTARTMDMARPIVEAMYQDIFDQIERKKIIKNQNIAKVDELKIKKLSALKQLFNKELRDSLVSGKASGQKELLKGTFRTPVADDKFLEILNADNFDFVGTWEFEQLKKIRVGLRQAILDGTPLSAVIDEFEAENFEDSFVAIERYSRTKTTEVFNRGRQAFFEESGVVNGYQYSAILDGRTTAICSGLHGKFFRSGKEPIPPLHFNCRSLLIPVTKFEEFTPTEKIRGQSPDDFIDTNIGKGFPKR